MLAVAGIANPKNFFDLLSMEGHKIEKKIIFPDHYQFKKFEIAKIVKNCFNDNIEVETVSTDDNRSYHISSEKIKNEIGFVTEFGIEDAVKDLINAFDNKLLLDPLNNSDYYNIKKMQEINLK